MKSSLAKGRKLFKREAFGRNLIRKISLDSNYRGGNLFLLGSVSSGCILDFSFYEFRDYILRMARGGGIGMVFPPFSDLFSDFFWFFSGFLIFLFQFETIVPVDNEKWSFSGGKRQSSPFYTSGTFLNP